MTDLDDRLRRYLHDTDLPSASSDTLASGIERCHVDHGLVQDRAKRFALWAPLHLFGAAPDLDVAFEGADDRDAARIFMGLPAASRGDAASG